MSQKEQEFDVEKMCIRDRFYGIIKRSDVSPALMIMNKVLRCV